MLSEGLRMHHYDAEIAYNGETALSICARGSVDLVLLDVCMPDIDGYEVCRRLKASPLTRHIPVIFVTVKGEAGDIERGRELGAVDYITKPYNLPMVMLRVEAALRNSRMQDRLAVPHEYCTETHHTDQLTGLRTRPYLMGRLQEELEKARRHGCPISCALFDMDEVKPIDEELGVLPMEDLIVDVAMALRNQARNCDILARCDFSEFAAVLPHTTLDDAVAFARRIVTDIDNTTFASPTQPTEIVLCSGIVTCSDGFVQEADVFFRKAMCRLFEAKTGGKERIVAKALSAA